MHNFKAFALIVYGQIVKERKSINVSEDSGWDSGCVCDTHDWIMKERTRTWREEKL